MAAQAYVEADRSRVDAYYLGEGSGVAMRLIASVDPLARCVTVRHAGDMDGATYETWVTGFDVETGVP